jgi:anion-transporting  ArsA/GET3 family ATPase
MTCRVIICCGSGGVGKTTISAALAIRAATEGQRVAVLTIDPARRLADSLSIGELSNTARRVPLGLDNGGMLDAMMLDARATFDEIVQRTAPSPATAQRILANRYYQFASSRLGGVHEYMAMERLLELSLSGRYDTVVLDTPPTRHALDFLRAPERMATLMDEGVLRWLVMPATASGWRALELGSEVVAGVLKRLLGQGTVAEIAEFFEVFRELWGGFQQRSGQVSALLARPTTRFLLVTTPSPAARADALYFLDVLRERKLPFGGFVVNRAVQPPDPELEADRLPTVGPLPPERWRELMAGVEQICEHQRRLSSAHRRSVDALLQASPARVPAWLVPEQDNDLHDLDGLVALGEYLPVPSAITS